MSSLSENNNVFISYPIKSLSSESLSNDTEPNMELSVNETRVNEIWTKSNFSSRLNQRVDLTLNLDSTKMSWSFQDKLKGADDSGAKVETVMMDAGAHSPVTPEQETVASPSHHARRPMNAFLIFCKKHRPIVRNKYPTLENRGVTRILGEWWALLDADDKGAYTRLAKEYKDAFFSANPNFKWYKLPAPPLRTVPIRPMNMKQESPPTSPTSPTSEFTPGKLADESQLGRLSSLLNTSQNFQTKISDIYSPQNMKACSHLFETTLHNNNNESDNNNKEDFKLSPTSLSILNQSNALPPKPEKKGYSENLSDNNETITNLFECTPDRCEQQGMTSDSNMNMTNQQIVNKVIDSQFFEDMEYDKNGYKDTRKSGRKGKGNRYAEFMANGKLLKNKRDKRDNLLGNIETPKLDLNNTIRRLEERIQPRATEDVVRSERPRTVSEMSEPDDYSKAIPSFNLDRRILELPTLSYEMYVQRKKESKKRKFVRSTSHKVKSEMSGHKSANLIGSKKRKNKHNITHLEKTSSFAAGNFDNDLSGLATLAEVAAVTEKIIDGT